MKKMTLVILLGAICGTGLAMTAAAINNPYQRRCGVHNVVYDLRFGCPVCKAPSFGF